MADDDKPTLWMLSGSGTRDRGGDSYFSTTTRRTRADHPDDLRAEWAFPAIDDASVERQALLTVTGWDRDSVFREYGRLWADRYAAQEKARRELLAAQSAARTAARPARTRRRGGW